MGKCQPSKQPRQLTFDASSGPGALQAWAGGPECCGWGGGGGAGCGQCRGGLACRGARGKALGRRERRQERPDAARALPEAALGGRHRRGRDARGRGQHR